MTAPGGLIGGSSSPSTGGGDFRATGSCQVKYLTSVKNTYISFRTRYAYAFFFLTTFTTYIFHHN